MSVFGNLKSEGLEETQDRIGGFQVRETDAYLGTIKAAYAGASAGGARNVSVILTMPDGGEYNETIYVTKKTGENWFHPKDKDGKLDTTKKVPLPGFAVINDICIVTTGKELFEQDSEEKIVKIFDYEERKELPKSVPMLIELIGQKFYAGIVKQTVDKSEKDDAGDYQPTGDTREENTIEKVFHHPTMLTVNEARLAQEGKGPAENELFFGKWVEKNKGKTRDKSTKGADGAKTGRPGSGAAPQAGATQKKTTSLFGK